MNLGELDRPPRRAKLAEQATSADGLELVVVPDQHQSPVVLFGEFRTSEFAIVIDVPDVSSSLVRGNQRGASTERPVEQ